MRGITNEVIQTDPDRRIDLMVTLALFLAVEVSDWYDVNPCTDTKSD